jgi:hypothetical protein
MKARLMRLPEWLFLFLAFTGAADAQAHRRKAWREGVVRNGLQFWYKFLSGAETADSSGNGRTLTMYNSPTFVAGPGGNSSAMSLNGINQYAKCLTADVGSVSALTVSCWVAMNSTATPADFIVVTESDPLFEWDFRWSAGTWYWQGYDTAAAVGYRLYSYAFNHMNWVHLTGIYESGGASFRFWVNGVQDGGLGGSSTLAIRDGASLLTIGSNYGTGNFLFGRLADVRIYDRALSQAEIDTIRFNP